MKIVKYKNKIDKIVYQAVLLLKGHDYDLLYLPQQKEDDCSCLIFCKLDANEEYYLEIRDAWTNVDFDDIKLLAKNLKELIDVNGKIVDKKEYELYLKLKKKYEQ